VFKKNLIISFCSFLTHRFRFFLTIFKMGSFFTVWEYHITHFHVFNYFLCLFFPNLIVHNRVYFLIYLLSSLELSMDVLVMVFHSFLNRSAYQIIWFYSFSWSDPILWTTFMLTRSLNNSVVISVAFLDCLSFIHFKWLCLAKMISYVADFPSLRSFFSLTYVLLRLILFVNYFRYI
jgi:hypothetical protein